MTKILRMPRVRHSALIRPALEGRCAGSALLKRRGRSDAVMAGQKGYLVEPALAVIGRGGGVPIREICPRSRSLEIGLNRRMSEVVHRRAELPSPVGRPMP